MTKFLLLIGGMLLAANLANAAPTFPELDSHVVDQVGLLSTDTKQGIANKLVGLEQQTSIQFVVAIVTSLEAYEIRDYGIQLARHWELGQKDVNNGVLLLVAPNERKVSIEVGYGLEGELTDALSFQIIQDYILPKFKQGQMSAGIELGADMILEGLAGEISAQSLQSISSGGGSSLFPDDIFGMIFMAFFFMIVIFIVVRAIRNPGSVRFGGGGSSSSSWGGSSGGFSGGGGSFGGGGASGGW